jgi:A/G-specific adenine glycosylase
VKSENEKDEKIKESKPQRYSGFSFEFFAWIRCIGFMNTAFQRRLVGWYRANRRKLPWRGTRDPYRIWVAEVMLQQTRVAAVVDYYRRFLRRFPTVYALARARRQDVLKHWAGLGYYSRARNLHGAAKQIVARHGGRFPRDGESARALPGVGDYTAAAVLSMAYGAPYAVLDGNVARVLARLGAVRGDLRAGRRWKQLQTAAQELMGICEEERATQRVAPTSVRAGEWNQAMMELGARVCRPRGPRCAACPVARWCRARKLGLQNEIPAARKKRAPARVRLAAAVLLDGRGRTLVVRHAGGLFSGMWQFPAVEVEHDARKQLGDYLRGLKNDSSRPGARRSPENTAKALGAGEWVALGPVKHSVTFREITLRPYLARVKQLPRVDGARHVRLAKLEALPISNATRKIALAARKGAP